MHHVHRLETDMSLTDDARRLVRRSRGGRKRAQPIVDIDQEPREYVGLQVTARFLDLSDEATLARLEDGRLRGYRDGACIWRVRLDCIRAYLQAERKES